MGHIIDGTAVSREIRAEIRQSVLSLQKKYMVTPCLAILLIGENKDSERYVRLKKKACEETAIDCREYHIADSTGETEIIYLITTLNTDAAVHGILIQLPLPGKYDESVLLSAISPQKDVDGLHGENLGNLVLHRENFFLPCTPAACIELILRSVNTLTGKHTVIVGRGLLAGRPLAVLLMQKDPRFNCTVTVCHSYTEDLARHTRMADVLVCAAGVPKLITADMIKPGAIVIDVGISYLPSTDGTVKMTGDVDFAGVKDVAAAITPVPGGVGPMTITMLCRNVLEACNRACGL